jgi:hypothetical protein
VFSELYRDPVQSEEVAALGDDLPSKLDRRVLLAPSAKENAQQLGTGKRLRTLRQKPLPRPELGRKLFDCVSASFHDGILYYTASRYQVTGIRICSGDSLSEDAWSGVWDSCVGKHPACEGEW